VVDPHLSEQRLASIRDHVSRIRSMRSATREAFLSDRNAQEAVAFNLFLGFQDALDLAARLIADREWELAATAREHFEILAKNKVLTVSTAEAIGRCAGLRNLIAHAYGKLDLGRLYDEVPAGLMALEAFCAEIVSAV
jgi:uncharacterized protein YutE (UPF0331/DUF86 family)